MQTEIAEVIFARTPFALNFHVLAVQSSRFWPDDHAQSKRMEKLKTHSLNALNLVRLSCADQPVAGLTLDF